MTQESVDIFGGSQRALHPAPVDYTGAVIAVCVAAVLIAIILAFCKRKPEGTP